jgi:hypothetical protein
MGPFLRAALWARHPLSWRRVKFGLIEHIWGWPDWLRVNGRMRLPKGEGGGFCRGGGQSRRPICRTLPVPPLVE